MKILLVLLSLIIFTGCNEDPYPKLKNGKDGDYTEQKPDPIPVKDPLSLVVADQIDFSEGRSRSYKVRAEVEAPGEPVVWVDNLPDGATFNEENFTLSWKPDFDDGNDKNDPRIRERFYKVQFNIANSIRPKVKETKTVTLKVKDTPRGIKIDHKKSASVREGNTLEYKFSIENEDYPQGPFNVITDGMPANAKLEQIDSNNYKVVFSPDFFHVNLTKDSSVEYTPKFIISNPAGHKLEETFDLTVYDTRLDVSLQTPNSRENPVLEQGVDASFQVAAYDLNAEVTPVIELTSDVPKFGHFKTELVENADSNSAVLNIKWSDIPPAHNGETVDVGFKACVLQSRGSYSNCEYDSVKIKIVVKDRKPPVIDRSIWTAGELIYLGFDQRETKTVEITDGEDPKISPKVEIYPTEMRKYVTWNSGSVSMKFDKAGVFQFSLKAISDYGTSTTESFQVEVFAQDRSRTLFFADSTRDPEVKFYKEILQDISLMNPLIQRISLRNISDRDTLILGTSILFGRSAEKQIVSAMREIKNLVIASPLIGNMPKAFLDELRNDYNMNFIGRYNELPLMPEINRMFFAHTSHFVAPMQKVSLKRSASIESANPLIFNGGLDEPNKDCKGVLGLTPDGNNPYVIGVSCDRKNGGRLVLLGTEWADLKVSEDDSTIPTQWFNTMLKGVF